MIPFDAVPEHVRQQARDAFWPPAELEDVLFGPDRTECERRHVAGVLGHYRPMLDELEARWTRA